MPHRLGRYAVRRRIGSGGFATVWLAYDEQLDSPVAIKVLADNWTEDHQIRQRFLEEGRYLRKVESPHVVSVYDAGELDDGRPYLVMSYADQGTLADRLEVDGLTAAQAMEVVRQVGAGLQALHDRDILHRDIKPANVLFRSVDGPDGDATACARWSATSASGKALDMSSRLTMIAGTPTYVAPEQASAEAPDARADQYSLAALAFLLLTGRPPFTHTSLSDAMNPGTLPPVSTPERPFPPEVDEVLHRGLARDRDDRYPSVTAFVTRSTAALGPVAAGPTTPAVARPRPRAHPARSAAHRAARLGRPARAGLPRPPRPPPRGAGAGRARRAGRRRGSGLRRPARAGARPTAPSPTRPAPSRSPSRPTGTAPTPRGLDAARTPTATFPALSVGDQRRTGRPRTPRARASSSGCCRPTSCPEQVPQHPECDTAGRAVMDSRDGDDSITVTYSDCPGGGVTVERVVQVTANTLLWVQIRSDDRATANASPGRRRDPRPLSQRRVKAGSRRRCVRRRGAGGLGRELAQGGHRLR